MKLTPTVIVEFGALMCVAGVVLIQRIELSAHEMAFLRALITVLLGLFFLNIGYARHQRENVAKDLEKRPPPRDKPE